MALVYISYGIPKSASTFAWQLIKRAAIAGGLPVATLSKASKGRNSPEDYIDPIDAENLRLIRADIGDAPVVIKTHGGPTPAAARLVAEGRAIVFASYRDLREAALSLLDHGARSRAAGISDFAALHTISDTIPLLKKQVHRFNRWVETCSPLLLAYDEICFDTPKTIARIAARLGITVDAGLIAGEFAADKAAIGQFNKGTRRRFEQELSVEEGDAVVAAFPRYYQRYFPAEIPRRGTGGTARPAVRRSAVPIAGAESRLIVLHIGTEKTGTKAVQTTSSSDRERLRRQGIYYPHSPGATWHYKLALYATGDAELRKIANLHDAAAWQNFLQTFAERLHQELAEIECRKIYFSSEHLSSRVRHVSEVKRIADLLHPIGRVQILCYVRPQHELLLSANSTFIKGGGTHYRQPPTDDTGSFFNYQRMLEPWAAVFGDPNIRVRVYDRETLKDGDIVADFFSFLGYAGYRTGESPPRINQSFDARILQFLLLFNKQLPRFRDNRLNPERAGLSNALAAISAGPSLSLPAAELRRIFSLFERSNAAVAKRFLGRDDGVLFPNVRFPESAKPAELTVEDAVEIAAHLWRWKPSGADAGPAASPEQLVSAAYGALLGRQPDPRGLETYTALFRGVPTSEGVARTIKGLVGSNEFEQKYARRAASHRSSAEHSLASRRA